MSRIQEEKRQKEGMSQNREVSGRIPTRVSPVAGYERTISLVNGFQWVVHS